MYHYQENIQDSNGTVQNGWSMGLYAVGGDPATAPAVTIYSDRAGTTPIPGGTVRSVSKGYVNFYVPSGRYSRRYYDASGALQWYYDDSDMVSTSDLALAADLASTAVGKGTSLSRNQDGTTAQDTANSVAPLIWRRLPSLQAGAATGTPAQNRARFQTQLDALYAGGGGILKLNEDEVEFDRGLLIRDKVSIEGPGANRCLLKSTHAYNFATSHIFLPGNWHPDDSQDLLGNSNSKAVAAVTSGDYGVTLSVAPGMSDFLKGDQVIVFSGDYYLNGASDKIFAYMVPRAVTAVSGSVVYFDAPLRDNITTPYIYNLRTGSVTGVDGTGTGSEVPLWLWSNAEMSGFSVETLGYWIGYSGTYKAAFNDINVRSQAICYGNFLHDTVFNNVSGSFGNRYCEISLNSENVTVKNFSTVHDTTIATSTAKVGLAAQENSQYITIRDGIMDVTGFGTGTDNVVQVYNAANIDFDRIKINQSNTGFLGTVLSFGDIAPLTNRRVCSNVNANINWNGNCNFFGIIQGATTKNVVIDGVYMGMPALVTSSIREAFRIGSATYGSPTNTNIIRRTAYFENGALRLLSNPTAQQVTGAYFGDGVYNLSTADYASLQANDIRENRTRNTSSRRSGTIEISGAYTVGTSEVVVTGGTIGTGTIQPRDVIQFYVRANKTGTAGNAIIKLQIVDNTTPVTYTPLSVTINSASSGSIDIHGWFYVTNASLMCGELRCSDAASATAKTDIVTDLSAKNLTVQITAIKGNAADTVQLRAAKIWLDNPVVL